MRGINYNRVVLRKWHTEIRVYSEEKRIGTYYVNDPELRWRGTRDVLSDYYERRRLDRFIENQRR